MSIKLLGPVDDVTGYGETARQIALAISGYGVDLGVQPQNCGCTRICLSHDIERKMNGLKQKRRNFDGFLYVNVPSFFRSQQGKMGIGLTMSETDGIPQFWVDYCNLMDRILVPSRFNLRTFRSSGVKEEKIRVVPLAVNSEQFTPEGPKLLPKGIDGSTFTFLSVGEWIPRKGYDILIKSFVQEFSSEDDVCLLLRCHSNNSDYDPNGLRISKEIKLLIKKEKKNNPPKIILLPQTLSSMDMPSLYRGVNCFVLATRGEGWNMPVFEALASGVPVITTNWSAHTEHLNHRNAYLVDIEGLEPIPPYGLFVDEIYVGHFWARPSVEHLRYQMRYVYRNYEEAKKSAQVGRKMVLSDLRWELTAEKIVGCFAELT